MNVCTICNEEYEEDLSFCCDECGRCGFCEYCSHPNNHDCNTEQKNNKKLQIDVKPCGDRLHWLQKLDYKSS